MAGTLSTAWETGEEWEILCFYEKYYLKEKTLWKNTLERAGWATLDSMRSSCQGERGAIALNTLKNALSSV